MKQNKKAIEMSMNTVIIAVLALLVLGILIFVLAKNTGGLNKGLSCPAYGGKCQVGSCSSGSDLIYHNERGSLCDVGESCCSLVPGKGKEISVVAGKEVVKARI